MLLRNFSSDRYDNEVIYGPAMDRNAMNGTYLSHGAGGDRERGVRNGKWKPVIYNA